MNIVEKLRDNEKLHAQPVNASMELLGCCLLHSTTTTLLASGQHVLQTNG